VHNALALYGMQFASYLFPLITIPYLARVLGPAGLGLLAFAQAFSLWTALVLEYGFNLSATREIAQHRDDRAFHTRVVAGVMGAKGVLAIAVGVLTLAAAALVPHFREHPDYLLWAVLGMLLAGLNPIWYFQGTERMTRIAAVDVGARFLVTIGILTLVKSPAGGWMVLMLNAAGSGISTTVMLIWMYREVGWRRPNWTGALAALRLGGSMFLFRGAVSLYTTANTFILGLFVSPVLVGYFTGAEKIYRAALGCIWPINQVVYPRVNHLLQHNPARAGRFMRLNILVQSSLALGLGIVLFATAPMLVGLILGPNFAAAIPLVRVYALMPLFVAMSSMLGVLWMVPLKMDRQFNTIIIAAGLCNMMLAPLVAKYIGPFGMVVLAVSVEGVIVASMVWVLRRSKRDPFAFRGDEMVESMAPQPSDEVS
jgi:PST family polysaccharide transporter